MFYSYVMGIDSSINELKSEGFDIKNDGDNYMVAFPRRKAIEWENYITKHLELGYWNEYLTDDGVVFLFHLDDGIKRYEVKDYVNDEVLALCEKLCECKFESLESMLKENHFYKKVFTGELVKGIDLCGCVEVPIDVTEDDVLDKFIEFIEYNGWYFGGGVREVEDE